MRKDFLRSNDLKSKQSQPDEIWDGETRNRLRLWDREDACHVSSNLECLTSMAVIECRGGSVWGGAEKGEHLSTCWRDNEGPLVKPFTAEGDTKSQKTWAWQSQSSREAEARGPLQIRTQSGRGSKILLWKLTMATTSTSCLLLHPPSYRKV